MIPRKELTPEVREEIVAMFLNGESPNNIVFLLNYEYYIDQINEAIRERMKELWLKSL